MGFSNIIIIGPTSSGKSDLANFLGTNLDCPVFNCDSVQVYKDLNYLSNKPAFVSQDLDNEEVVSYTKPTQFLDFSKYKDFNFKIFYKEKGKEVVHKELESSDLLQFLIDASLLSGKLNHEVKNVSNYLFDIKSPLESYSIADFKADVDRITNKQNINQKIIVGGTIYYAYHYILGTEFDNRILKNREDSSELSLIDLIKFLESNDPKSLELLDNNNVVRLNKAVEYIKSTGNKFSDSYFKKPKLLEDFFLIMIYPKDRGEYHKRLNSIVQNRINSNAIKEIIDLRERHGHDVDQWLEKVSYEYKYAIKLTEALKDKDDLKKIKEIVLELQAKERQYTKRQMTFMRKLSESLIT